MMLAALLATAGQTAVDAERTFNRAAQTKGQWTAFREFAAPDAVIFKPQPAKSEFPDKDPPIAVQWWPAESYVSCDGATAINTGPWMRPDSFGYFTTIWKRGTDGTWKWIVDHGDVLPTPRALPERTKVRRASCSKPTAPAMAPIVMDDGYTDEGESSDRTLFWRWTVEPDGQRRLDAYLWNGRAFDRVIFDKVAAPARK